MLVSFSFALNAHHKSKKDYKDIKKQQIEKINLLLSNTKGGVYLLYESSKYSWNTSTSNWKADAHSKNLFTYDSNGNITLEISYDWDENTSTWVDYSKVEYAYDSNGNQILEAYFDWDTNTNTWVGSYRHEYTYDANGNNTFIKYYNWEAGSWAYFSKQEISYDTNGNEILAITYGWSSETSTWNNNEKLEYTYDTNGDRTLRIQSNALYSESWGLTSKSEYAYDANRNLSLEAHYEWDSEGNSGWFGGGEDWTTKTEYIYSLHQLTAINNIEFETELCIFPNPTSEYINVENKNEEITSIAIYTMQGRIVLKQTGNSRNAQINVSSLAKGSYIVLVNSKTQTMKHKFVKK